jgi:hypothetical protein
VRLHGRPLGDGETNITYEDIKRAADENGRSVAETLDIMSRTEAQTAANIPANTTHRQSRA